VSSASFSLRVRTGPRDLERFPFDDDALGESLFERLSEALEERSPSPVMLVFREGSFDQFELNGLDGANRADRERMMAAMAGQEGTLSVAFLALLDIQISRVQRHKAAVVYLEWPDSRWWTAWQLVGEARGLIGEAPFTRRAVDGWPKPGGVGGWFSRARRENLRLHLERPGFQRGMELVH
jgi:hypothetical protein